MLSVACDRLCSPCACACILFISKLYECVWEADKVPQALLPQVMLEAELLE